MSAAPNELNVSAGAQQEPILLRSGKNACSFFHVLSFVYTRYSFIQRFHTSSPLVFKELQPMPVEIFEGQQFAVRFFSDASDQFDAERNQMPPHSRLDMFCLVFPSPLFLHLFHPILFPAGTMVYIKVEHIFHRFRFFQIMIKYLF